MQTPQPISQIAQIDLQIDQIKTEIFRLEMGHDFLDREDKQQIAAWNQKIEELEAQRSKLMGV